MKVNQKGFTLIELIVVIVILGILSATALPKFFDLAKDARLASLNAAKGSLASTGSMAHGSWLLTNPKPASISVEGATVTYSTAFPSGYPKADLGLAAAAGLNATDFTLTVAGTTLTVSPVSTAAANVATCSVVYNEPVSATAAPVITVPATAAGC